MKKLIFISIFFLHFLTGCKKDDTPLSGTVTINNNLYGTGPYYAFGFSFVLAKEISTREKNPPPDISVDTGNGPEIIILQADNLNESFHKVGDYSNATAAEQAFKNLTSAVVTSWEAMGDSIRNNQIWIYRSGNENYAKLRIIGTKYEPKDPRDYTECTFEWVYQPDGTLTFPGK